jgi:protein-tyrosine phosphatase
VLGVAAGVAAASFVPGTAVAAAPSGIRQIPLQGAVNVRDIGGYRAGRRGRSVRYGVVYRADALGKLTDADVAAVGGLRLDSAVDFRMASEVQMDGADRLPSGVAAVARPISDGGLSAAVYEAIGSRDPARQEAVLGGGRGAAMMRDTYRRFVSDAEARDAFAATLRDVGRGRSVLFHCTAGKDRTGWLAFVLLSVLGVPVGSAVRDYLASNRFRAEADAATRAGLERGGVMQDADLLIPIQEVRAEYLRAGLARARVEFGGLGGYVERGLGVRAREVAALRERLVC